LGRAGCQKKGKGGTSDGGNQPDTRETGERPIHFLNSEKGGNEGQNENPEQRHSPRGIPDSTRGFATHSTQTHFSIKGLRAISQSGKNIDDLKGTKREDEQTEGKTEKSLSGATQESRGRGEKNKKT